VTKLPHVSDQTLSHYVSQILPIVSLLHVAFEHNATNHNTFIRKPNGMRNEIKPPF